MPLPASASAPKHQLDVSVGVTEFHDYRSEPSCRQALQQKATPASGRGLESPTLLASSNANSPGREKIRTSSGLARVSMSSRLASNRGIAFSVARWLPFYSIDSE